MSRLAPKPGPVATPSPRRGDQTFPDSSVRRRSRALAALQRYRPTPEMEVRSRPAAANMTGPGLISRGFGVTWLVATWPSSGVASFLARDARALAEAEGLADSVAAEGDGEGSALASPEAGRPRWRAAGPGATCPLPLGTGIVVAPWTGPGAAGAWGAGAGAAGASGAAVLGAGAGCGAGAVVVVVPGEGVGLAVVDGVGDDDGDVDLSEYDRVGRGDERRESSASAQTVTDRRSGSH